MHQLLVHHIFLLLDICSHLDKEPVMEIQFICMQICQYMSQT